MLTRECVHCFIHNDRYFAVDGNSGAVHLLDKPAYQIVLAIAEGVHPDLESLATALPDIDKDLLADTLFEVTSLIEQGLLFSNDETDSIARPNSVVKALCLNVAHDCNMRCRYCFADTGGFGGTRELMSLNTAKAAVDFLISSSGMRKQLEIDFFGGEPLLNFEVVRQTVLYGKQEAARHGKEFRFTITTNGLNLTTEIEDFINEHMYNVVLSLDGRKQVNDLTRSTVNGNGSVYDTIVPKYQRLRDKRGQKSYYVRGTFTKANLDFSRDVLHMVDLGFDQVSVEPVVADPTADYALTDEELPEILQEYHRLADQYLERQEKTPFNFFHFNVELKKGPCLYKRIAGCGAGHEYLAVSPDGKLYPCHQFVGKDEYKMGSVFTGMENRNLRAELQDAHVLNKPTCQGCWAKYYCSGGCHANNLQFSNSLYEPYKLACTMEKKRLECSFFIQAVLAEKVG